MSSLFYIFGGVISIIGGISYLVDTLKGRVKPNKVTWFFWALIPFIVFIAEISQGIGLASILTFTVGFNPLLIFIASFVNKKAYWKLEKMDLWCAVFAVFGIILWITTKNSDYAILFSIIADFFAGLPTLKKSFLHPQSENSAIFFLGGFSSVLTLLAIPFWSIAHFAFPLYIFVMNMIFGTLIQFRWGVKLKKRLSLDS